MCTMCSGPIECTMCSKNLRRYIFSLSVNLALIYKYSTLSMRYKYLVINTMENVCPTYTIADDTQKVTKRHRLETLLRVHRQIDSYLMLSHPRK